MFNISKRLDGIIWDIIAHFLFFAISVGIMIGAYLYHNLVIFIVCAIIVVALSAKWRMSIKRNNIRRKYSSHSGCL